MKPIRILIADSDVNFSKSLQNFLGTQADMRVVDTVRDGQGAVDACKKERPDLVLMDLHLPVLDSVRAIQSIMAQNEHIKILGISSIPDDHYAIEAIKAGAYGYVHKSELGSQDYLVQVIHQVANGEVLLNPTLATSILQEFYKFLG